MARLQSTPQITRQAGDIQSAVVALVDSLVTRLPPARQPTAARRIAETIASVRSSMADSMWLRQSLIRNRTATCSEVVDALTTWIVTLFDLGNLRQDRRRALEVPFRLSKEAASRLDAALSRSTGGCILAVPHVGSLELLVTHLVDRRLTVGFVQKVSESPTAAECWIYEGRGATRGEAISFGHADTANGMKALLDRRGVIVLVTDVYPSDRGEGIPVKIYGDTFNYAPGPAWFGRSVPVLPAFVSARDEHGLSAEILDAVPYDADLPVRAAAAAFTQELATSLSRLTIAEPSAFWLWHPIPNDPFLAIARRRRPDLAKVAIATSDDDERAARAVDALEADQMVQDLCDPRPSAVDRQTSSGSAASIDFKLR